MNFTIETRVESKRGCGWRNPGGLYLVADGPGVGCGRLPVPLIVCPTCSCGIKPTRGWTWVNAAALMAEKKCGADRSYCRSCPMNAIGRAGLLWIGGVYYQSPDKFDQEARQQGISRRVSQVPRGFKVGETWILLAHRQVIVNADGTKSPGVFRAFQPQRIEYVVKPDDSDEKLSRLADRGITLVRIERAGQTKDLPLEAGINAR